MRDAGSPPGPDQLPELGPPLPDPLEVRSSDGTSLAAYDLGGRGTDVVLVHATGLCAGVWGPIARRMQPARVVLVDVRGHGRSDEPADDMDWNGTAQDVLATIDRFGLDRPVGVGHSMGGASLLLAEQARPATFAALWVYEPIVFPPAVASQRPGNPLADAARRRRDSFPSARDAFENFASKGPFDVVAPEALAAYVRHGFRADDDGTVTLRCSPELEARTYEMGARHDGFAHLGRLGCPVTVARGRTDAPGPASIAPLIVDALGSGQVEEHPDLGHFGPLEDPAAMAAAIDQAVTAGS